MPLPSTMTPIATTTLTSAAATITFSSIPSTYTDIVVVGSVIGSAGNDCHFRVNGDSGTNYSNTFMWGSGSAAGTGRAANSNLLYGNITSMDAGEVNTVLVSFNNYSNTTTYKTTLVRYNSTTTGKYVVGGIGMWRSTAAINSIIATTNATGNFAIGTTFTLYGIKAA